MPNFRTVLWLVALVSLLGCGSHSTTTVTLPSFDDVYQAPPAIQTAGDAVVEIQIADGSATGSFISASGLLLTNNHVLGVDVCFREGCYAQILFMYQRHEPVRPAQQVFVVPIAVDIAMDIALVQAYAGPPPSAPLSTPAYLNIASHDPASLLGTHINVVGHPDGALKKWTAGEVVDTDGTWIFTSAFIFQGNSGSPILDDSGTMVGIIHRVPDPVDLETSVGLDEFSIGTASSAFAPLVGTATLQNPILPASIVSEATSMTDDEVATNQGLFYEAQVPTANVGGAQKTGDYEPGRRV